MSSSLEYEPLGRALKSLGTGLKLTLRAVYGDPVDAVMGEDDIRTLKAIIVTTGDKECQSDARKLIEAIEKHGEIHVKETNR